MDPPKLEIDTALRDLIKIEQAHVVQSVDVGNLNHVLRWLIDHAQDNAAAEQGLRQALDAAESQIRDLVSNSSNPLAEQALKDVQFRLTQAEDALGSLHKQLEQEHEAAGSASKDSAAAVAAADAAAGELSSVKQRLAELEALAAAASGGTGSDGQRPSAPAADAGRRLGAAEERLLQLEQQLGERAVQQRAAGPDEAGVQQALEALRRQLAAVATSEEASALRRQLGDKVDRQELDALLQAHPSHRGAGGTSLAAVAAASRGGGAAEGGGASSPGAPGHQPPLLTPAGELDPAAVSGAVSGISEDVGGLMRQLALLQERLKSKAGGAEVVALQDGLQRTKADVLELQARLLEGAGGGAAAGAGAGAGPERGAQGEASPGAEAVASTRGADDGGAWGAVPGTFTGQDARVCEGGVGRACEPAWAAYSLGRAGTPGAGSAANVAQLEARLLRLEALVMTGRPAAEAAAAGEEPGGAAHALRLGETAAWAGDGGAADGAPGLAPQRGDRTEGAAGWSRSGALRGSGLRQRSGEPYLEQSGSGAASGELLRVGAVGNRPGAAAADAPGSCGGNGGGADASAQAGMLRVARGAGGGELHTAAGAVGGPDLGALWLELSAVKAALAGKASEGQVQALDQHLASKAEHSTLVQMHAALDAALAHLGAAPLPAPAPPPGWSRVALQAEQRSGARVLPWEPSLGSGADQVLGGAAAAQQALAVAQPPAGAEQLWELAPAAAGQVHGAQPGAWDGFVHGAPGGALDVGQLAAQVQHVQHAVQQLAQVVATMAVGGTNGAAAAVGAGGALTAAPWASSLGSGSALGSSGGAQALAMLDHLLHEGLVQQKMDAFDPALLDKLMQWLPPREAGTGGSGSSHVQPPKARMAGQQGSFAGATLAGGGAGGVKGADAKLKRLAQDVKMIKDWLEVQGALGRGASMKGGGAARVAAGDHAMLSSRPLMGYRCMACDRPLTSLSELPGPHIPANVMPVPQPSPQLLADRPVTAQLTSPAGGPAQGAASAGLRRPASTAVTDADGSQDKRGPLHWYGELHGPAAAELPPADVGPHLPPGGWRANSPRAQEAAVLPQISRVKKGLPSKAQRAASVANEGSVAGDSKPTALAGLPNV